MKKFYAILKLNKINTLNFGFLNNSNTEAKITFHTDTLFDTEEKAIEYINNVPDLELLTIKTIYVTGTSEYAKSIINKI